MVELVPVEEALLGRVQDATNAVHGNGLAVEAFRKYDAAQRKTVWGLGHQRRWALVEGGDLLASAEVYDLAGTCGGSAYRICGVGSLLAPQAAAGGGHSRTLLDRLLEQARQEGAEMALLFPHPGLDEDAQAGFEALPVMDKILQVAESTRHGAPMTLVRVGEERDLTAIVEMGRVRAASFGFHLDRDRHFVRHATTRKRLLAGLGPAFARQLHFFIAEEGITAAAYVVVSVAGDGWILEECGDRDPTGARVGALLQALIAREPIERRPIIRGWLPLACLPPQVTIVSAEPSTDVPMVRWLSSGPSPWPLSGDDVCYWRNDVF